MSDDITRAEHIQWCKDRAIQEYDYGVQTVDHDKGVYGVIASLASDLGKHSETQSSVMIAVMGIQLHGIGNFHDRAAIMKWINDFN